MKKTLGILAVTGALLLSACAKGDNATTGGDAGNQQVKAKIGVVQFVDHVSLDQAREGFIDGLKEEGVDAEIGYENAQGESALTTTIAQKFQSDEYDLVYAIATPAAQGVKNTLPEKKLVFSAVTDPVGAGLVKDMETPSTVTGVSDYVDPKGQIETFLKLYPNIKTFGTVYSTSEQNSQVQIEELQKACEELGLSLEVVGITNINDIPQAIASLSGKIDAYFAITDNTVASGAPIVTKALNDHNLPSLSSESGQVKNGLLMSEGVNYYEHGKQAAKLAAKLLRGEEAAPEKNENNTKYVNKKTAELLGLDLNNEVFQGAEIVE